MTTFYSIDFESSDTNPFVPGAQLLTVGICVIDQDGNMLPDEFYRRFETSGLGPEWFDTSISVREDSTLAWWRKQNDHARMEAYELQSIRHGFREAWDAMVEWMELIEPDKDKRFFVANPSGFEYQWINWWAARIGAEATDAGHYRVMCLRSASWGRDASQDWGGSRTSPHKPVIEHHAIWDAIAQGEDLCDMLKERQRIRGLSDKIVMLQMEAEPHEDDPESTSVEPIDIHVQRDTYGEWTVL